MRSFLILFFLLQINNATIFASDNKANRFITRFPTLTFSNAKKQFCAFTDTEQKAIWHKLDTNKKDTAKLLPLALHMAHMEPELQYAILSEDFKILRKLDTKNTAIPNKIFTDSIYALFRWNAVINKKLNNKTFLKIVPFGILNYNDCSDKVPKIQLSKPTLFSITIDHLATIKKPGKQNFRKKELQHMVDLPDNVLEELRPYYRFYPNGHYKNTTIRFPYYQRPTIRSALIKIIDQCFFILPLVLYTHFYVRPTWNAITSKPNPISVANNIADELHNKSIDNLLQAGVTGSEHLIKKVITPICYQYSWQDYGQLAKPITEMAFLNTLLLFHSFISAENQKPWHKQNKSPQSLAIWRSIQHLKSDPKTLIECLIGYFPSFLLALITTPALYMIDQNCFTDSVTVSNMILAGIGISAAIAFLINLKDRPIYKFINFSKDKFKDKTVKEVIKYYLSRPNIIIKK